MSERGIAVSPAPRRESAPRVESPLKGRRARILRLFVETFFGASAGFMIGTLVGMAAGALGRQAFVFGLARIGAVSGLVVGVVAVVTGRELIPRMYRAHSSVRAAALLCVSVIGAVLGTAWAFWFFPWGVASQQFEMVFVASMNTVLAIVAASIVYIYEDAAKRLAKTRDQLARERLEQARTRERAARAELQALQARINPHFFFNALNTAAAYVQEEPQRAERLLERFAGLFRYSFRYGRDASVRLEDEVEFIRNFLEIEQARFGETLKARVILDPEVSAEPVPPLVLQPLVENAVNHGRDPDSGRGEIEVRAGRDPSGELVITVVDGGPGPGAAAGEFPRGHALENIASRVAASRGGELTIEARPGGKGTVARLVFPSSSSEPGVSERGS